MSKDYLKKVFGSLLECDSWSFQIIQVNDCGESGASYFCHEIELVSGNTLLSYIKSIKDNYCSKSGIDSYVSVDSYTGDMVGKSIYKLQSDNELISNSYISLVESVNDPDVEVDISNMDIKASLFRGYVIIDEVLTPVFLISMHKPITTVTNRFFWVNTNRFRKIEDPILTIRKNIDVAIIGENVYFLSVAGENLFLMERSYKHFSELCVKDVINRKIISDSDSFSKIATRGYNPRRFVAYNKNHVDWLTTKENRIRASEKFGILLENGLINTTDEESTDKLIRFLCNKAMLDPCDETAVETANAKPWI